MPNICRKLLLISIFFFACKRSTFSIQFSGVTPRDASGAIMGTADSNDWNFNDQWQAQESALFNTTYTSNCPAGAYSAYAYPNPCSDVFYLRFNGDSSTRIDIRIVDKNFTVLLSKDSVTNGLIAVNSASYPSGISRVYYKMIKNGCEFRGHGDIEKQ